MSSVKSEPSELKLTSLQNIVLMILNLLSVHSMEPPYTLLQESELYQWRSSPACSQFVEVEELHSIPPDWVLRVIFNNYSPSLAADGASQPSWASLPD